MSPGLLMMDAIGHRVYWGHCIFFGEWCCTQKFRFIVFLQECYLSLIQLDENPRDYNIVSKTH